MLRGNCDSSPLTPTTSNAGDDAGPMMDSLLAKDLFPMGPAAFEDAIRQLYRDRGLPYPLSASQELDLFQYLSHHGDLLTWEQWSRFALVSSPKTAAGRSSGFIVVDVQNDFISGSLALRNAPASEDGAEVVPVINGILSRGGFDVVVYTRDAHPHDHISFFDNLHLHALVEEQDISRKDLQVFDTVRHAKNPELEQTLWPTHCVKGTWGYQLCEEMVLSPGHIIVEKGESSDVDSYSAFFDNGKIHATSLDGLLSDHHVTDLYICGLALDICVGYTALDALQLGYRVYVVRDACRGTRKQDIEAMLDRISSMGGRIISSDRVEQYLCSGKLFSSIQDQLCKDEKKTHGGDRSNAHKET